MWNRTPGNRLPVCTASRPRTTPTRQASKRLLQDAVGEAEEDGAQGDGPPAVPEVPEAGEDEAAECQFFTDCRHQGEQEQDLPQGRGGHEPLDFSQDFFDLGRPGVKPHHDRLQGIHHPAQGHGQNHRRRDR